MTSRQRKLDAVVARLQLQYGPRAIRKTAAAPPAPVAHISMTFPDLDAALGIGGLPRGRITEIIGPATSGKVTLAHGSHLTLLAETQAGYANLSRLLSIGQLAGTTGNSRLAIEDIARHATGLLCLSGCRQGAVAQAILVDAELAAQPSGKIVKVAGMVVVRQAPPTAKGHLFITLGDETGLINLLVRPDLYAREQRTLHGAAALMIEGRLQREGAAISVLVQALYRLDIPH
jgi:DNA polymerase III alpha subunit